MPDKGRRRSPGEGSIFQRSDGKWVASMELRSADSKRKRRRFIGERRQDVRKRLLIAQAESTDGPAVRIPDDTPFIRKYAGQDVVYFVQNFEMTAVKIGYTSDIAERMSSLRTASGARLAVVLCLPGDCSLEAALHRRFHAAHLRGEWFRLTLDLEAFIRRPRAKPTRFMEGTPGERRAVRDAIEVALSRAKIYNSVRDAYGDTDPAR